MIPLSKRAVPSRGRQRVLPFALSACAALSLVSTPVHATPVPANLGNGLDRLVSSHLEAQTDDFTKGARQSFAATDGRTYSTAQAAAMAELAIKDEAGRFMVRVYGNGTMPLFELRKSLKAAIPSFSDMAADPKFHGTGVMNARVALEDMAALAQMPGIASVVLELKPRHAKITREDALASASPSATVGEVMTKLGTDFDQGVTQHRVDQINKYYNPSAPVDYEGQGMQIACISNSFNAHTAKPASTDVTNFDLPGASGNPVNTTPVYVYLDDLSSTASDDEGRGMCQIAYKMAPKAAIAFGTADTGEVGFANVIRGLAGIAGYTNSGQTFAADTICDDVGYFDEPYFQDGIIGMGVDDASAAGVCYFSSAANDIGTNGYDSDLRFVANGTGLTAATGNTALAGTNINLAGVPAALYAGGFHNFNPNGLDVAQTVNDPSSNTTTPTVLQWNEPYDQTAAPNNETLIWTQNGNYTSSADNAYTYTITPSLTAGTIYELDEIANGDGFDGAITITDPNGNVIVPRQDNAVDEVVRFQAPVTGTGYTVTVGHYSTTTGAFTLNLYSTTGFTGNTVKTRISLLVFDSNGNYLPNSSGTTDATATDEPIQLVLTTPVGASAGASTSQVQFVIARANVPAPGPGVASHVRYLIPGNGLGGLGPDEYFTYTTVTTGGHAMASTCNGCAAYSVFRPSLPEYFTSPGPVTVYFDKNNNPLATPDVRLQPRIGAADAANVSSNMNGYFASDSTSDPDTNGNFSGTSAAGPHAAAIGALVLQAHGGRRSITPAQMTSLLERSTFPHDLDPNFASGSARVSTGGKVTITISSDNSSNTSTGLNDNNAFAINYIGSSSVTSFVFNPGGTSATAGNVSGGNNGVTYSPTGSTTVGGTATYFSNSLPGTTFRTVAKGFTLGTGVTGATAVFSNPSSAVVTENYTMTITIPTGNLSGGQVLHFGVGRGVARTSSTGNTGIVVNSLTAGAYNVADIFGGGVIIPDGTVVPSGMTFSGTTADGGTFSGVIKNNIGAGYSPLDGYGFVNAQTAVGQTVQ